MNITRFVFQDEPCEIFGKSVLAFLPNALTFDNEGDEAFCDKGNLPEEIKLNHFRAKTSESYSQRLFLHKFFPGLDRQTVMVLQSDL